VLKVHALLQSPGTIKGDFEVINAAKLLLVELVNSHVDDTIRLVNAMSSEKSRTYLVDIIESLDQ